MLGQTGQGVLLNRPKEAYDNSSYDGYKTHIDYAHALLKYGFGYGDDCSKRNVYKFVLEQQEKIINDLGENK